MRRSMGFAIALAALGALMAPGPAGADVGVPCTDPNGCPDIVPDAAEMKPYLKTETFSADDCAVEEGMVEAGARRLLRFTSTTPNLGAGDLIVGDPAARPDLFEFSACHGHFHFKDYANYFLWTPEQFSDWDAVRTSDPELTAEEILAAHPELSPVVGRKMSFCLLDAIPYGSHPMKVDGTWVGGDPPKKFSCVVQGITRKWADEYEDGLDGQWIDATGIPSGTYVLENEFNPVRVIEESDYSNNRGTATVQL